MQESTTIRIAAADKRRLERLREAWRKGRDGAASQQEVLGRGLEYLEQHRQDFLDEMAGATATSAEWDAFLRPAGSFPGVRAQDLDEVLYGEPHGRPR